MEDWKRSVATGVVSLLIGTIALRLIPEIQTSSDIIDALNNPLAQLLLLVIVIYVLISGAVSWVTRLLSKERETRVSISPYRGSKPDTRTVVGEIRYSRVNWPFLWGETRGRYHGWVDRPNCSACGTGLSSDTIHRRVRSNKTIWECPACGFTTDRGGVIEQREAVQQIVEQESDRIIQSLITMGKDEIESMLNEIEETAGVDLNLRRSNHKRSESERQSINEAIDKVVDNDDLQNREKVMVLDHLLGCKYGPQDQYDVLWYETDKRGVRKAIGAMS